MSFAIVILIVAACHAPDAPRAPEIPFAIRIVDESVPPGTRPGQPSSDLLPIFKGGPPGAVWLQHEGSIEGAIVTDAHVGTGADGSSVVLFTLTPQAADRLASLTRANVGKRLAMVVGGKVVLNTLIAGEAPHTSLQFDGHFTPAEASAIAAGMMKAHSAP